MSVKTFVDTNVLIYAYDIQGGGKHEAAVRAMDQLWMDGSGYLSPQVLQEFYVNVTKKLAVPISSAQARYVVTLHSSWCIEVGAADIAVAFRIQDESRIGFWDAMILAAARKAGAGRVLSEDMNAGQRISGILIENPFAGLT